MRALRFATGLASYKVCGQRLGLQQAAFNPPTSLQVLNKDLNSVLVA